MDGNEKKRYEKRLNELQQQLADLRKRWPAHSVKAAMVNQWEEIEEEIRSLQNILR
ncbi:MAG: histidine kinase [Firmicutes bacterium]|nr:histidine kinase [Bacillota bacterium]